MTFKYNNRLDRQFTFTENKNKTNILTKMFYKNARNLFNV